MDNNHEWKVKGIRATRRQVPRGTTVEDPCSFSCLGGTMPEAIQRFAEAWPGARVVSVTRFSLCPSCSRRSETATGHCTDCRGAEGDPHAPRRAPPVARDRVVRTLGTRIEVARHGCPCPDCRVDRLHFAELRIDDADRLTVIPGRSTTDQGDDH